MKESEMYPLIGRFLEARDYAVGYEIPQREGSCRRIDVVGIKPRKRIVVSVEAKLGNYNKVLAQAVLRLLVSDLVYVSFQEAYALSLPKNRREELANLGIGLIAVGSRAREVASASRSIYTSPERRADLIDMVMKRR